MEKATSAFLLPVGPNKYKSLLSENPLSKLAKEGFLYGFF